MSKKLSTESYKGVRDFYPEEQFIQNFIFGVMRKTVESFGYEEYHASILEPSELYKGKTSEEIVNQQTFTFKDRGDREVTLRPEMTPTVARMVAAKRRELGYPLRLYSIPNLFRYEQPQRGRLREHWQLNVDLFGLSGIEADAEIIAIAHHIMTDFGFKEDQFEIRFSRRDWFNNWVAEVLDVESAETKLQLARLWDQADKMSEEKFIDELESVVGTGKRELLLSMMKNKTGGFFLEKSGVKEDMEDFFRLLIKEHGVRNIKSDVGLVRGFDYYTGMVFEVYDKSGENSKSIFGGGRYDNLLEIFDREPVPTVGFGMGDVRIREMLETYGLLPSYKPSTHLYICIANPHYVGAAEELARDLRRDGVNVAIDYSYKKIEDQRKVASKHKIPYLITIDAASLPAEATVRNTETFEDKKMPWEQVPGYLRYGKK